MAVFIWCKGTGWLFYHEFALIFHHFVFITSLSMAYRAMSIMGTLNVGNCDKGGITSSY